MSARRPLCANALCSNANFYLWQRSASFSDLSEEVWMVDVAFCVYFDESAEAQWPEGCLVLETQ